MFGFSTADWIFIGFILIVIFVCIVLSDMLRRNKHDKAK
jgi:Sec-independent protein translocase protein TatA